MRITRTIGVFCLLGGAVFGCSGNQSPTGTSADTEALGPGKVATVNGRPIAESVLRVYALANRQNVDEMNAQDRGKLVDDLIGVELLRQEAEKTGVTTIRGRVRRWG